MVRYSTIRQLAMDKTCYLFVRLMLACTGAIAQNIVGGQLGSVELDELNVSTADFPETSTLSIGVQPKITISFKNINKEMNMSSNQSATAFPPIVKHKGLNESLHQEHLDQHHHQHDTDHYPIAKLDFESFSLPFLISVWLVSACLAKIGMCAHRLYFKFII